MMPGLTLLCDFGQRYDDHSIQASDGSDHGVAVMWRASHVVLFAETSPEYPITRHVEDEHVIVLEGAIYEAPESPWWRPLLRAVDELFAGQSEARRALARWLKSVDGEFVLAIQCRPSGNVVVVNDYLGRLPLYVHRTPRSIALSRDIWRAARTAKRSSMDRMGAAEHLLYGYPLAERTLIDGIQRLEGGSIVEIRTDAKEVSIGVLSRPYVGRDQSITHKTLRDAGDCLATSFRKACVNRAARGGQNVVSLSGGLDSRSIAAAFFREEVPVKAVTFGPGPGEREEVTIARDVASLFDVPWTGLEYSPPTGRDLLRLLKLKGGLNYLGMAFILRFCEMLKQQHGAGMVGFVGDGGQMLKDKGEPGAPRLRDRGQLLRRIVEKNQIFALDRVSALTGVSRLDILSALEARVSSYPEEDVRDKYTHFRLLERETKFVMEGADRNRSFFWTTCPFYGQEFFAMALSCPAEVKENFALYRCFIEALDARLVDVRSTTCGANMRLDRRPLARIVRVARRAAPGLLKRAWVRRRRPTVAEVRDCIELQLRDRVLDGSRISDIDGRRLLMRLGWLESYMLLTLTSAVEYLRTENSALEKFTEARF